MKKLLLIFVSMLFSITFVSARPISSFLDEVVLEMEPILSFILGDVGGGGEILFIKFLAFLLILAVSIAALRRVPQIGDQEGIVKILAIIIALLAARYLTTEELINLIWLPYGVLGIALSSFLPLIIYFFFIEGMDSAALRKIGWGVFAAIYLGLTMAKYDDFVFGPEWWQNYAFIYLAVVIISLIMLLFDKRIYNAILISAIRKGHDTQSIVLKNKLMESLDDLNKTLASPHLSNRESSKLTEEKQRIEKAIRRIR